jgi:hypothetical protein
MTRNDNEKFFEENEQTKSNERYQQVYVSRLNCFDGKENGRTIQTRTSGLKTNENKPKNTQLFLATINTKQTSSLSLSFFFFSFSPIKPTNQSIIHSMVLTFALLSMPAVSSSTRSLSFLHLIGVSTVS